MNIVDVLLQVMLLGTEWVLWLLLLLSVVSVGIILERLLFFSRMRINFPRFSRELTQALLDNNQDGAMRLCERQPSLEGQVAMCGFQNRHRGSTAMEESMTGFLLGERQNLDRGLTVLGTLGNNAVFIGLFGTVLGIIQAFHDLSLNPQGGPTVVMAGVSEALVATAVGLMVAIPAVIAFNSFQRVVKRRYANAEAVMRVILSHQNTQRGQAA